MTAPDRPTNESRRARPQRRQTDVQDQPRSDSDEPVATAVSASALPELDDAAIQHLVGFLLAMAHVPGRRVFQRHIGKSHDLRPAEFVLLVLLLDNRAAAPKQLSRAICIAAPHLTLLLDRLVARRLVERHRNRSDGRGLTVSLTASGEALAHNIRATSLTMENGWLSVLSPGERLLLRELLRKLAAHPMESADVY